MWTRRDAARRGAREGVYQSDELYRDKGAEGICSSEPRGCEESYESFVRPMDSGSTPIEESLTTPADAELATVSFPKGQGGRQLSPKSTTPVSFLR